MKALTCACCGNRCVGKQWWNRDHGYGLCPKCVPFILDRETPEELRRSYGNPGDHFATPLALGVPVGALVGWVGQVSSEWRVGTIREWRDGTATVREHVKVFTGEPDRDVWVALV